MSYETCCLVAKLRRSNELFNLACAHTMRRSDLETRRDGWLPKLSKPEPRSLEETGFLFNQDHELVRNSGRTIDWAKKFCLTQRRGGFPPTPTQELAKDFTTGEDAGDGRDAAAAD
jgi:hypothetical protein